MLRLDRYAIGSHSYNVKYPSSIDSVSDILGSVSHSTKFAHRSRLHSAELSPANTNTIGPAGAGLVLKENVLHEGLQIQPTICGEQSIFSLLEISIPLLRLNFRVDD